MVPAQPGSGTVPLRGRRRESATADRSPRRSAARSRPQYPFDCRREAMRGRLRRAAGVAIDDARWRGDSPARLQRLARIDVAEAGDDALVEERDLQRRTLAGAGASERRAVEIVASGSVPSTERRVGVEPGRGDQIHHAEAARIVERHHGSARHLEHHVVVQSRVGMVEPARSRHAEMHEQGLVGRQVGEEILAAARQRPRPSAAQPRREASRKRPPQIPAPHQHALEAGAVHHRLELAADRLHFRQFGHCLRISGPGSWSQRARPVQPRGFAPGLPDTLSRAPLRRRAPFAWLARSRSLARSIRAWPDSTALTGFSPATFDCRESASLAVHGLHD